MSQTPALQKFSSLPSQAKTSPSAQQVLRRKPAVIFNGMTEAEVIAKAQQGDVGCFEALYAQHKRRVFSLCLRMSKNYTEAEDYVQETFLQLYRKISSFRFESAFSTWLHRLAVNVVLMHFRRKGLVDASLEESLEPQHDDEQRREFGADDISLVGSIDRLTLENAIAALPPGYRMIFVLHDVEGYEHNEIAEMLGCSIGNSKSQLHKARMKLRTFLSSLRPTERPGASRVACTHVQHRETSRETNAHKENEPLGRFASTATPINSTAAGAFSTRSALLSFP